MPVEHTTCKNVPDVILETLNSLGINPKYIVGQGYDGAAAMTDKILTVYSKRVIIWI